MAILPASIGDSFPQDLSAGASAIGVDPLGALALMLMESGLNPAAFNSIGAVGINQLIPKNYGAFAPLSVDQYRSLTADQQLPYALRFWQGIIQSFGQGQTFWNGRDLYWLNFLPATFVPGADDSHVISQAGDAFYSSNTALDIGNKGFITAGDLAQRVNNAPAQHPHLWAAIAPLLGSAVPSLRNVIIGGFALGVTAYAASLLLMEPKVRRQLGLDGFASRRRVCTT